MLQLSAPPVTIDHFLLLWLASQRPRHFLVRCSSGCVDLIAEQVMGLGAPPVRLCRLPGPVQLPTERTGTLVLGDVAALDVADQIALYDWLGTDIGALRVISVTAAPLGALAKRGAFFEGLVHRLGAVQFSLTTQEYSA